LFFVPNARDPVLTAEQEYLESARGHLARMREQTESLSVQGGNHVSTVYLQAALWRRAQSLIDDPSTALFFGRTDHLNGERWYIGRRYVSDENGDPLVIDWRATMSRSFYRADRRHPLGVRRRRRFGLENGHITAYEDEYLVDGSPASTAARGEILAREIERPRVGPMRDIVATIQPEQDEIVRADLTTTVCVQGAPGTGKTAVGLHRAAWLLYENRERLGRTGLLIIGPNRSFLEHISAVLPSLGEVDIRHTTIEELVASVSVRGNDSVDVATVKGDARMAEVLRRAVWSHVRDPQDPLVLPRGSRRWRVPVYEIAGIVSELRRRGVRYEAARQMLPQRLAHALLVLMEAAGESPDDRVQNAVARSGEVRRCAGLVWPAVDPRAVLHRLLVDDEYLAEQAEGLLTHEEQSLLHLPKPPRTPGATRWSPADAVLLDELADILQRTPSLGHVVLDEAQDLSPMQLRAVGRRCSTGSATVLGDIAQGTTPWATPSWKDSLAHLGQDDAHVEHLDRGFRVPATVIDYAARLLPVIAPELTPPSSVRDDRGSLQHVAVTAASELWPATVAAVTSALPREGSIGIITADSAIPAAGKALAVAALPHGCLGGPPSPGGLPERITLVPATFAKGLEFDDVIVVEPADITDAEPDDRTGLRRLYVVLTRAVSHLTIVHHRAVPEPLGNEAVAADVS
jgi:DNA helicase IV